MIRKQVCSISISELISTTIILTLAVVIQEASWLNSLLLSSPTSLSSIQLEQVNQPEE